MFKKALLSILIGSLAIFLVQCSNDDKPVPTSSDLPDSLVQFQGITETDDLGKIQGGDLTDWCYTAPKSASGELPTEYALYPAFPNPCFYQMEFIYDLPTLSDVHLYIIDTAQTIIRTLIDLTQPAGRYQITWNLTDGNDSAVAPGIYRVIMEAGDFNCYGDIQIVPDPLPDSGAVVVITGSSADGLAVSYDSPIGVAALWMIFVFDGSIGTPVYDPVTYSMNVRDNVIESANSTDPDTLKILIATPVDRIVSLPEGFHYLCDVPVNSGRLSLDYVEASDEEGRVLPTAIIKQP